MALIPALIRPTHDALIGALATPGLPWEGGGGVPVFDPRLYGTLAWWLRGDDMTLNGADVSSWNDKSGNGRHWTQGTALWQPAKSVASLNGRDGVVFAATALEHLLGPNLNALGMASAEMFLVGKAVADPAVAAGAGSGIWQIGTGVADYYPFTDGVVYTGFGSAARKTVGNMTTPLTAAHVLNVITSATEYTSAINGATSGGDFFTTATNAVGWYTAPTLGKGVGALYYNGTMWEMIVYSAKLSTANRAAVVAGLKAYYGIA